MTPYAEPSPYAGPSLLLSLLAAALGVLAAGWALWPWLRRQRRRVPLLLLGGVALPAPLAAVPPEGYFWDALCSSGAVVACGSVLIRTVPVDAQNNFVQVLIRNLQGFDPRDNTLGSIFNTFSLLLPDSPWAPIDASVPIPGTVGAVGFKGQPIWNGSSPWADGSQAPSGFIFYQLDRQNDVEWPGYPGDGVRGCEHGPFRPAFHKLPVSTVNTCAAQGYTGWATLATRVDPLVPYQWNITGASFVAYGANRGGQNFQIVFPAQITTVTPEPATWTLLGVGLVVVALLGRRRQRRQHGSCDYMRWGAP